MKIVSGHNAETMENVARLYEKIVTAGVHRASSIKVAEAAKITENIQRDVNIALMNELSLIYSRLNIDTYDVLKAAGTKWNFHNYTPGLVGGHCIGVDPYYLAYKATEHGYHPKMILSGREINDYMARHLAEMAIKELNNKGIVLKQAKVLLLGLTFKEDVSDMRNSRAKDVVSYLREYGMTVYGCEPNVRQEIIEQQYNIASVSLETLPRCDAVIFINKHKQFSLLTINILKEKTNCSVLIDVKRFFSKESAEAQGIIYKSL
jgi:UDP-N-acetyl-D-galactosamine dehydrogenase